MSPSPVFHPLSRRRRGISRGFLAALALSLCGAGGTQPPSEPALQEGLTLEREIRAGETHVYPVELQEGWYLRMVVQENGLDLAVRLVGPDGKVATGVDTLGFDLDCQEDLAVVAEASGPYRLEIAAVKEPPVGSYKLSVLSTRTAGEQDQVRAEAVRARWEAFHPSDGAGEVEQTIRSLEHARELWQRLQDGPKQAEVLFLLGNTRLQLPGGIEKAIEEFRQSALLLEGEADLERIRQIKTLNSAGNALKQARRTDLAAQFFAQAAEVARDIQNPEQEAISLNKLGLLEVEEGEIQKGMANLLLAQEKDRLAGAPQPEPFNNLGYAYELLGEKQKAIQNYQKTLDLTRSLGDRKNEATALNNLGDTYYSLGDWETALRYFQQALDLFRALKNRSQEATLLNNLGTVHLRLGRFEEADRALEQALQLSRETQATETETAALISKAELALRQERPAEALHLGYMAVSRASGFWAAEADARQILGVAHRELGELQAARTELERAAGIARERGDFNREAYYTLSLARTDRLSGDLRGALSKAQSATDMIESVRARVANPELKALFLASTQDYYELQIDILMSLHAAEPTEDFAAAALEVSEQARARSLLEILQESVADIREGVAPSLLAREKRLREEVNAREWRRLLLGRKESDAQALSETKRRVEEAREDYLKFQDELRVSSPRYAALTQPSPLTESEIRAQLLNGQALLLEYKLGKDRSVLWAVSPESTKSFELSGREEIEQLARRWYELLTVRNNRLSGESVPAWRARIREADVEAEQVACQLSELILRPVEDLLGDRPLLVVADGALQYVPFAALPRPSTGSLLVEGNEVVNLPSASALAALRRDRGGQPQAPKLLAILADPVFQKNDERLKPSIPARKGALASSNPTRGLWGSDDGRESGIDLSSFRRLPYSLKEAQTISSFVPKDQLFMATGLAANRAAATSPDLALYRIVHFATHGVLDSRRPELSSLVFSLYDEKGTQQDGFLRLNDIYNLHLEADLVVLSACRTALGKEIRGEGLVGLTRGFMYAGASRVLASLWSVEDRATAELMGDFYRGMLREGLSPAAALRKAQIEMAKTPHHQSPYHWAGFSLQGEWR